MKMNFFYSLLFLSFLSAHSVAQTSEELSLSFIKKLQHQQFDSCYYMFDSVIANKISVDMLIQTWNGVTRFFGEYKSYSSISTENKDTLESVFIHCEFEKTKMDLQLVYNIPPKKIVGMFFTPPKNKTAYVLPDYALPHKFYEIKIAVKTGALSLPGSLCVPNNIKNPPVVILLAGSGPNDKDETIGPNKTLKDIATGLASNGIATYRYDKRTLIYGKEINNSINEFDLNKEVIEDAMSAITMIRKNIDFKQSKIYIVGHSLGAMCAPLIASKSKAVNGIVLLSGNARPLEDLLLEQYNYIFNLDSIDISEKKELKILSNQIDIVKDNKRLKTAKTEELPLQLTAHYWKSLNQYQQVEVAKKVKQPILIIQGERDYQVSMKDFNLWKDNLNKQSKNKFISYPGLNHLLINGSGKSTPEEYQTQGSVDQQVIIDITNWIKTN